MVGKEPGIRRALHWNIGRSAPVSIHLETPREPTMGTEKMLTEMNGDPWTPMPQPRDKPPQVRGVYITLERQIKHGGTKGCTACFGQAKVHSSESRRLWITKLHR